MPGKRLRPQDLEPLDPADFGIAFQIALDSGQNSETTMSSSPWERARFALKRHFVDQKAKFESADFRFRALMDLYTRNILTEWVRGSESTRTEIHPAVLDVASRLRLASNGKFPVRKFLEEVTETATTNYADLAEWPLNDSS